MQRRMAQQGTANQMQMVSSAVRSKRVL